VHCAAAGRPADRPHHLERERRHRAHAQLVPEGERSRQVSLIPHPTPNPDPNPGPSPNPDPNPKPNHNPNPNPNPNLISGVDLYPAHQRSEVDATNAWVYEQINNGVYRCGFATKQAAYERAERDVHAGLTRVDELLSTRRFLCGETLSEADVRLLPTGARFDGCYAAFFRCGRRQIRSDYPHLARWLCEMLELTGPLFDLDDARRSYYTNLFPLNPGGIVPAGPTPADLGFPDAPVAQIDASAFSYYDDRGEP
jgi:hypothetical protein